MESHINLLHLIPSIGLLKSYLQKAKSAILHHTCWAASTSKAMAMNIDIEYILSKKLLEKC